MIRVCVNGRGSYSFSLHHYFGDGVRYVLIAAGGAMGNFLYVLEGRRYIFRFVHLMKCLFNFEIAYSFAVADHKMIYLMRLGVPSGVMRMIFSAMTESPISSVSVKRLGDSGCCSPPMLRVSMLPKKGFRLCSAT